jgi:PBSX family phage terminase large subunit
MRNFWLNWQEVIRPTLTDTRGEGLFISTPKGFNHFYDLFNLQEEDTDFKSFHFSTYDNSHIPADEIDKAKQELSPERFAQEYMADFKKTEGLVYKDFDRSKHVLAELPRDAHIVEKIGGADFGFTNPCAIPDIYIDAADCWYVVDEFYETGRTDAQVAEYAAAKGFNAMYPDPEAPAAIVEMRRAGVPVRDVVKGKDSIKHGIDAVRDRLRAGKLKVLSRCGNTIWEFETYAYPDRKPDHNEQENPIDENNHMMDAIRYPVFMRSRRHSQAAVHYAPSAMPRNNLPHQQREQGSPPPELSDKPKAMAHTYIPRL